MIAVLIACLGIGLILLLSEFLWRKKIIAGEYGRKIVHQTAGLYIASWPFFMPFTSIGCIALGAIIIILLSRKFKIFHAIHDVKRKTYGELLYPISIFMLAAISKADWIFAVAVLFVALADGMAAVIGKKWGTKKYSYDVWKARKTVVGTLGYIVFAYVSLGIGVLIGGRATLLGNPFVVFVWLPLFSALLEAVSPYGLDNITAPLVVAFLLNVLFLP
jgi:phytol kinase